MTSYYARILKLRSFRKSPVRTIARALQLFLYVVLKKDALLKLKFGSNVFFFQYVHGDRFGGGRGLFLGREYIEDLLEFGDRFLKVGDTVIDGGANQGVFTTAFGSYVGPTGLVVAVEPMEYATKLIERNAKLNGFADRLRIYQCALSDTNDIALLDLGRGVGAASITNNYGDSGQKVEVRTVTIDTIVAEQRLDSVDLIKLDIEGAELRALRGAKKTLQEFNPLLCLEISTGSGTGDELQAHEYLLDLGYEAFYFLEGNFVPLTELSPPHENVFYMRNKGES